MRSSGYVWLAVAIIAEVIGTSALRASEGFTRLMPALVVVAGYGVAFYCLSMTLKTMPVGIVYAIWSGVGIVLIATIAWLYQGQKLDPPALVGMALIVTGVVVLNRFSRVAGH